MARSLYSCELAWLGGASAERDVVVEVVDGRIADVAVGITPPREAHRLEGLTLPGLGNAHSHAFHRALRGRTHTGSGSFWTWRDQMYRVARQLTPASYRALARATYAEMVLAGITSVGEFHYLHHDLDGVAYPESNAMGEALIAAATEAGVRITLLDTCYLHGGFGADGGHAALNEVQRRFSDGAAAAWEHRVEALLAAHRSTPGVRIGAAVHSVRAVDPEAIAVVAGWARRHGLPLHAHLSEQPAENDQCHATFGSSPTSLLDAAGALDQRFTAVHATHLTQNDIDLLGQRSCTVCFCPTTERDLADGVGPSVELVAAGVRLCVGSDSQAMIDPFEELRALELDARLVRLVRGSHDVESLLVAATSDGQRSIGWADAGRLEVGMRADLVTVGLRSVRLAGTTPEHALAAVVFAASPDDVHHVVIDGEVIVRDGRHLRVDVASELRAAIEALDASEPER